MHYPRHEAVSAVQARVTAQRSDSERLLANQIVQAALAAEHVTNDPHWDRMLSFMQAALEDARKAAAGLQEALLDPRLVNQEAIMRAKIDISVASERIRTLEAVIALPADLKKAGAQAKLKLEALNAGSDDKAA
jgi:hypothetical protein